MNTKQSIAPRFVKCAALLVLLSGSSVLTAADSTPDRTEMPGQQKLAHSDMSFIDKIAKLGAEEVQLSQLAATQGSNESVRQFGEKLVAAHEKANAQLSQLASNKGLVLPTENHVNVEKWAKKRGKDFDKDYLDAMIDAHKDAVELLEKNATKAEDSDVAAFARDNLPAMQERLRLARELKKGVD